MTNKIIIKRYQIEDFINILLDNGYKLILEKENDSYISVTVIEKKEWSEN